MNSGNVYLFNLTEFSRLLASEIDLLHQSLKIPSPDLHPMCYIRLLEANLSDVLDRGLYLQVRIGSVSHLDELLTGYARAFYFKATVENYIKTQFKDNPSLVSSINVSELIITYSVKGMQGVYEILSSLDIGIRNHLAYYIEHIWPYSDTVTQQTEWDIKVERLVNALSDLNTFTEQQDEIEGIIDDNPFLLWSYEVISTNTIVVRDNGDYRIHQWERDEMDADLDNHPVSLSGFICNINNDVPMHMKWSDRKGPKPVRSYKD